MNKENVVSINDICFAYESNMVLKNISMNIKQNRICFIMGNNGSGKTTLLKNITGFLIPQSGNVIINDLDISKVDKKTLSKYVSYVPQAIHLNTDFSVFDYLSLGRTPYLKLTDKLSENDYQIIEEYSTKLGIDDLYDIPFNKLSGGQKQMVCIARSLIQETSVIVLDEPMSALDLGKQAELLKYLFKLSKVGKTFIMTTHNPNHALVVDSDSCFIQHGKIISYGKSSEIIDCSLLNRIYGNDIIMYNKENNQAIAFNKNNIC